MYRYIRRKFPLFGAFFIILVLLSFQAEGKGVVTGPLIWDVSKIDSIKADSSYQVLFKTIINKSNSFCKQTPVVVTEKKKTYAPDNHYYCSIGTYWWPDPENPEGKYIHKDGITNPERNEFDAARLSAMCRRCRYLSVAFYLTGDLKYYEAFLRQLDAWFINEETYMYPNLEYGQVIPGHNNNKGRSTGTIDAYYFNDVIESIRLVNSVKAIDNTTISNLQSWFKSFIAWLKESDFDLTLNNADNNVGLAYDVTLCNMYLFVGKNFKAKKIAKNFRNNRIARQIEENGMQPSELRRTKAFTYSLSNLKHIVDFSYMAQRWYGDFYVKNCGLVDKAFAYLLEYVNEPVKFSYQQITSWEDCRKDLQIVLSRRNKLTNSKIGNDMLSSQPLIYGSLEEMLK